MAKKKMTQREKAERARIKKKLQQEGLLPPDKPLFIARTIATLLTAIALEGGGLSAGQANYKWGYRHEKV